MAYKSLYRVYRPQVFEDVAGQEHIIKTLRHAVEENKIAHAYLFCGPRGTGKTTVAKLLAKAINCTAEDKPCGQCEHCKAIEHNNYSDVIEIDAASNNGVEEVRNLIDKVKYAPSEGKYKVYIIDEVHMMSTAAFNALLKTLEEPPAHVVFILATTEPHKILPTIISRCQRFDFTKITDQDIVKQLKKVSLKEKRQCDDNALELIAKLAKGGMRDALSILEQCLAYDEGQLTFEDVSTIYGIVSMDDKINLIKVLLTKDMNGALNILNKMDKNGTDIKLLTYDLVDILKDIVIYKNTQSLDYLFVLNNSDIQSIVPYISSEESFSFIDILMEANEKYVRAVNPHIYFELAILKICNNVKNESVTSIEQLPVKEVITEVVKQPYDEPIVPKTMVEEYKEPIVEQEIAPIVEELKEDESLVTVDVVMNQDVPPTFEFEKKAEVEEYKTQDGIEVDKNDIMNVLVQANKKILIEILDKWPIIKRYTANLNTAKSAGMLSNGRPVAASENAIVIAFEHMPDVNAVNYYKNYKQLSSFLKEVLSKEYKFVAMQQDEWLSFRQHFIDLNNEKKLPQPRPITFKHIDSHDLDHEDLTEAQKYAIDMFGDLVEFSEED